MVIEMRVEGADLLLDSHGHGPFGDYAEVSKTTDSLTL